jgi:hypothetical protein
MIRMIALFLAAAAAFGLAPYSGALGPALGAALPLAAGMALAVAASSAGGFGGQAGAPVVGVGLIALPAAGGALGALASAVLSPISPAAAGAALVGLAFAERTSRVRGLPARIAHAGVTALAGAAAGAVATSFSTASLMVRGVSLVVVAVLIGLPLLLEADDPAAHALDGLASCVPDPSRSALREGAELRRASGEVSLDRKTSREVRATWRALVELGEARARLTRVSAARGPAEEEAKDAAARIDEGVASKMGAQSQAVAKKLDDRIAEHVRALTRALTAVDAARAAEVGLNDAALRSVETVGESYEHVSRSLVDEG